MTQKAKQFLSKQGKTFKINAEHGGIVGSLVALGFVVREGDQYHITAEGQRWVASLTEGNKRG